MKAPKNKAKALKAKERTTMDSKTAGASGRTAVKFRDLKMTALPLNMAASYSDHF